MFRDVNLGKHDVARVAKTFGWCNFDDLPAETLGEFRDYLPTLQYPKIRDGFYGVRLFKRHSANAIQQTLVYLPKPNTAKLSANRLIKTLGLMINDY